MLDTDTGLRGGELRLGVRGACGWRFESCGSAFCLFAYVGVLFCLEKTAHSPSSQIDFINTIFKDLTPFPLMGIP